MTECPDPNGYLENRDRLDDHEQLLADLHAGGYISRDARAWLDEVLTRLRPVVTEGDVAPRFIHGDVTPANVLVHDGRSGALIDWYRAGWPDSS